MSNETTGSELDKRRAFVQALLAQQSLTFGSAKPLIAAIETAHDPNRPTQPEDISQATFEEYIQTANDALSPFDFEIRSSLHQTSRDRVYALVNGSSDTITQMATNHSADEIAYIKRVLDAMFDTYNTPRAEIMALTAMQALKLNRPVGESQNRESRNTQTQSASSALTLSQAERVVKDMVSEGWFELSNRGYYSLTPRALMELRSWLVETYNDGMPDENDEDEEEEPHEKIKFCAACRDIVTVGQRCPNLTCGCRMHTFCVGNKFRAQGGSEKCPTCKTDWNNAPPVGELAAGNRARGSDGRKMTNGMRERRRSSGMNMAAAADDSDTGGGLSE